MDLKKHEAQDKKWKAPTPTPDIIEKMIVHEDYHVFDNESYFTLCCLTLKNGFKVIGESFCSSQNDFNWLTQRRLARKEAVEKIWPLEKKIIEETLYQHRQYKLIMEENRFVVEMIKEMCEEEQSKNNV